MNTSTMINNMVSELNHNHRKYNDGCGDFNYDLLSYEMALKDRIINKSAKEAPEWVWDSAVKAVEIFKSNNKSRRTQQLSKVI